MTLRRAAPGIQVSTGRLRVDAARAIAKLREYQLAERAAWVLEGVRAAVASRATSITVRGDANDIWLSWDGPAWPAELLPRLFDELVSPEPAAELQHVRLLAAAVNSALGLEPAYVDVYTIASAEAAQRVRYTPDVLAEPENELGEAALRHVGVEDVKPLLGLSGGMLVHLRRRASLQLVNYWLGEPPELPIVRDHCRDIAVPLRIGDEVLTRERSRDVVRVPLGDGLDGFVAVCEPREHATRSLLEVAERGVVLARYAVDLLGFEPQTPVPLRVFVDADRLPTNASRSQVRRDVHPISTAERRARPLVAKAVAELAALAGDGSLPARTAALALLASSVAGHPAAWRTGLPASLEPLAKLPLLTNATGEPRAVATPWRSIVYTGRSALDRDLFQWVGEVLWLRDDDDALRGLLGSHVPDARALRQHLREARRQRRAHRKFLAHAKRELRVQTTVAPRVRAPLGVAVDGSCVPDRVFDQMRGELCVYGQGRDAALAAVLDGRELERVELESVIAFDAVIESDRIRPAERYRGVARDDGFAALYTAMRAGVVRAIEALAADADGVELEARADTENDMALVRHAVALAHDLALPLRGPLVDAPAWVSVTGERLCFAQLRARRAIGVVGDDVTLVPPKGRHVVVVNGQISADLRRVLGQRVVPYRHAAGVVQRVTPAQLASRLATFANAARLQIVEGDVIAAIAFSHRPHVALHHMGKPVGEHELRATYARCAVAVDCDEIVPNEHWTGSTHDAGFAKRSYVRWEQDLLRAVARALLGDRPPELDAPERIVIDDDNGRELCRALVAHDPADVLGAELLARFKAAPLFSLLGTSERHSALAIAGLFPSSVPFVDWEATQVDGYHPLVATEIVAKLVATLAERTAVDGFPELERRKRRALFDSRVAALMREPERVLALPGGGPAAAVGGHVAKGTLGLGDGPFEIRVCVASRPFAVLHPPQRLPLMAVVNVDAERCDEVFSGLPADTAAAVADEVVDAVPALLELLVDIDPARLDSAAGRALLAAWLEDATPSDHLREKLENAAAFLSVQGTRISIADAAVPRLIAAVAAWADTWLAPAPGEPETELDRPVLRVRGRDDELFSIIERLLPAGALDQTADVARLQARRRMARGLLPTPKVSGVPPEYKRELSQFGGVAAKLGHGEIALVQATRSTLLIHVHGQLQRQVDLDVIPAIQLAVEDPHETFNYDGIRNVAQELAVELTRLVLENVAEPAPAIRSQIARAVLANRVPPVVAGDRPLFMTAEGAWVTWGRVRDQLTTYNDVWAVSSPPPRGAEPLDADRIVLFMNAADIELAMASGYNVIDARYELLRDAEARANKSRPRARDLGLPWEVAHSTVLATVDLDGDGKTAPRGTVAVLVPSHAASRSVIVHKEMQPLGRVADACRWPTIAVVDDARLVPDRTWAAPKLDDRWQALAKEIRGASEEALATVGSVPDHALVHLRITNHVCADILSLRDVPSAVIRGVVWLAGLPLASSAIAVRSRSGTHRFAVPDGLAIEGDVVIYDNGTLVLDTALAQLCRVVHAKLVRAFLKSDHVDRDAVAAHVAHAIAVKTVRPTEVSSLELGCFAPRPISTRALATLLRRVDPVPMVKSRDTDEELAFFDDGSELARVVRSHLGDRVYRPARSRMVEKPAPAPAPPRPASPVSAQRPAPAPPVTKKPPPHPLRHLVAALSERMGQLGLGSYEWRIDDVDEPMLAFTGLQLVVAGHSPALARIASELDAQTPLADLAIDSIAAHAVTVLNEELTAVTDGNEAHALGVLLVSPRSAGQPRSHRSS